MPGYSGALTSKIPADRAVAASEARMRRLQAQADRDLEMERDAVRYKAQQSWQQTQENYRRKKEEAAQRHQDFVDRLAERRQGDAESNAAAREQMAQDRIDAAAQGRADEANRLARSYDTEFGSGSSDEASPTGLTPLPPESAAPQAPPPGVLPNDVEAKRQALDSAFAAATPPVPAQETTDTEGRGIAPSYAEGMHGGFATISAMPDQPPAPSPEPFPIEGPEAPAYPSMAPLPPARPEPEPAPAPTPAPPNEQQDQADEAFLTRLTASSPSEAGNILDEAQRRGVSPGVIDSVRQKLPASAAAPSTLEGQGPEPNYAARTPRAAVTQTVEQMLRVPTDDALDEVQVQLHEAQRTLREAGSSGDPATARQADKDARALRRRLPFLHARAERERQAEQVRLGRQAEEEQRQFNRASREQQDVADEAHYGALIDAAPTEQAAQDVLDQARSHGASLRTINTLRQARNARVSHLSTEGNRADGQREREERVFTGVHAELNTARDDMRHGIALNIMNSFASTPEEAEQIAIQLQAAGIVSAAMAERLRSAARTMAPTGGAREEAMGQAMGDFASGLLHGRGLRLDPLMAAAALTATAAARLALEGQERTEVSQVQQLYAQRAREWVGMDIHQGLARIGGLNAQLAGSGLPPLTRYQTALLKSWLARDHFRLSQNANP